MPRKRGSTAAGISDLPRIAGGINENGGEDVTKEEIVKALETMLTKIGKEKLWVNPDCGLKTRGIPETEASLRNMVEAAKIVRGKYENF